MQTIFKVVHNMHLFMQCIRTEPEEGILWWDYIVRSGLSTMTLEVTSLLQQSTFHLDYDIANLQGY